MDAVGERQSPAKQLVKVYGDCAATRLLGKGHVWYRGGVPVANLRVYGLSLDEPLAVVQSGHRKGAYYVMQMR